MAHSNEPVRIAFCITDLDPGGAERALVQLVTRLDRQSWEPAVFCLAGEGSLAAQLRQADIPVTCFGARGMMSLPRVLWQLARELKRFRAALLQTFLFHGNIVGRVAGWWAGISPIVSGVRVAEKRSRWPLRLDRWTNALVVTNVCVSQAVADFSIAEAGLSPAKTVAIPNGVEVAQFEHAVPARLEDLGIPTGSRLLVAVGRLDPQKGLKTLVEAAAPLLTQHPDVHLLLVGEGPERRMLTAMIQARDLSTQIHLAGWRADVPEILARSTALVLSSYWEGMPNVVLEAMAAGLPVVATRVEGIAELVQDDQTGWTVPIGSASELQTAMSQVLSDPERARQMGQAGQELVRSQFSWDAMMRRYDALYRQLLTTAAPIR
ncbi:MAG: glycosyltransferase [Planctomycetes bacterium]|nr:glycosyltransferase [Planctomycetota bacterium]